MQTERIKNKQYTSKQNTLKNDKTLKGVLINNHIKNQNNDLSFDEIHDSLLICDKPNSYRSVSSVGKEEPESSFNINKAIKPLLIGSGLLIGGSFVLSSILKNSSKAILNSKSYEQLSDLAVNMNIKEEPHFALYRAIRNPNYKNIVGAAAVFLMSGITIGCKNFVDGAKEIWVKKQSADIEKNLQENLIQTETDSFSGKLNFVNDLMSQNAQHFKQILNRNDDKTPNIFRGFLNFKGKENILNPNSKISKKTFSNSIQNTESNSKQNRATAFCSGVFSLETEQNNKEKINNTAKTKNSNSGFESEQVTENKTKLNVNKNIKYAALTLGVAAGGFIAAKFGISNLKKMTQYNQEYANGITEKTIEAIKKLSNEPNKKDVSKVTELLESICAKPEFIKEIGQKYNLTSEEIEKISESVQKAKTTIFADAPTALGGIPKKIQYYCYLDENRGHLYNWIQNPDNKFTKYIFAAFTTTSAIGYIFKQGMDAIKEVAVLKENAKTELNLRKRLVDVEIENFKSKKSSAINPLIENFDNLAASGTKSKEELKQLADNILTETKNGPPYVYT